MKNVNKVMQIMVWNNVTLDVRIPGLLLINVKWLSSIIILSCSTLTIIKLAEIDNRIF